MTEIPNLPPPGSGQSASPQPPSPNILAAYLGKAGFVIYVKHMVDNIVQQMHQGEQMWQQGQKQIKEST